MFQEVFHSKTNSIPQRNKVLSVVASKIDVFLWRDSCVSSTQWNRPIRSIRAYLHLETPELKKVFLSKSNTIITGKQ
jgi:hypothetical protein